MKADRVISKKIVIDSKACKGCHICIDQCSQDVLELSRLRSSKGYLMPVVIRIEDCSACMLCEMICPDMAITVDGAADEK
jgi:2-oxoglutarate ferredoxin oxidoreductase subunit delta